MPLTKILIMYCFHTLNVNIFLPLLDGINFGTFYGSDFVNAFVKALLVIILSELGDKTFFIAAIFSMKHPRINVFLGAIGALGLMTLLSGV